MGKALLYLRVSSKGQEDNYSLDAQEKLGYEYAKKNNLEIVKVWRGAESAWGKKERRNFGQMLEYSKKHEEVKHIIFDILDRMTRNDFDKMKIMELVSKFGKVIHFSRTNKIYDKTSGTDEEFMMDIEVAVAKKMSNDISRKTKMGMQEKAEQGIYPSNCPLGYINNRETGKIDIDPVNAPLVKDLFYKVASGTYSLKGLEEEFFAKGLRHKTRHTKVPKTSLYRIIYNPFYYGEFQWGHKMYKGIHTPLISKEIWEKAIKTLQSSHRPYQLKHKYAFGGLLVCGKCNCTILGQMAKKKYTYYRCSFSKGHHQHDGYLKEEELANKFGEIVHNISFPSDITQWLEKGISELAKKNEASSRDTMSVLKNDYDKTYQKLNKLYDLQLEGKCNSEMFGIKEKELSEQLSKIKNAMASCGKKYEDIAPRAKETFFAVNNLESIYDLADNTEKAKILKLLANKYTLEGKEIKADLKKPFCYFAQAKKELYPSNQRIVEPAILGYEKRLSSTDDNINSSRRLIWGG